MNKVFCSSCGHKNVYEVTKPKFCADCGEAIGFVATAVKKGIKAEITYEDEPSSSKSFDLSRLKNDIVAETDNGGSNTLSDLWKSATPESGGRLERSKPNLPDGDDMIKQSQADCASSRIQEIDG